MSKDNTNDNLKSIEINEAISDEAPLSSATKEDYKLIKLIHEREHQKEIEVDLDDL